MHPDLLQRVPTARKHLWWLLRLAAEDRQDTRTEGSYRMVWRAPGQSVL